MNFTPGKLYTADTGLIFYEGEVELYLEPCFLIKQNKTYKTQWNPTLSLQEKEPVVMYIKHEIRSVGGIEFDVFQYKNIQMTFIFSQAPMGPDVNFLGQACYEFCKDKYYSMFFNELS